MSILGVLGTFLLPSLQKHLSPHPALHERVLRTYLAALLVGDFVHVAITLHYTPAEVRWAPQRWTLLMWGNVAGTLMPNFAR